jgi:Restriction endonuclease
MTYSFDNLSYADFEDLARDLLGQEIGVRFEGFSAGPDGGIDGRHAASEKTIILQAKHYAGSPFSSLKAAMAKSRPSIDVLRPSRYLLATSRPSAGPILNRHSFSSRFAHKNSVYTGILIRAPRHDPQNIIRQWPLKLKRLFLRRHQPRFDFLLRCQDDGHGLRVNGANDIVWFGSQETGSFLAMEPWRVLMWRMSGCRFRLLGQTMFLTQATSSIMFHASSNLGCLIRWFYRGSADI